LRTQITNYLSMGLLFVELLLHLQFYQRLASVSVLGPDRCVRHSRFAESDITIAFASSFSSYFCSSCHFKRNLVGCAFLIINKEPKTVDNVTNLHQNWHQFTGVYVCDCCNRLESIVIEDSSGSALDKSNLCKRKQIGLCPGLQSVSNMVEHGGHYTTGRLAKSPRTP
jgi:hypothetical protein